MPRFCLTMAAAAMILPAGNAMAQEVSAQRCEKALRDLSAELKRNGATLRAVYDGQSGASCSYRDIRIDGGYPKDPTFEAARITVAGSILAWNGEGTLPGSDLMLSAEGLRLIPRDNDARAAALQQAQSRLGPLRLDLSTSWNAAAKTLQIARLDLASSEMSILRLAAGVKNVDLSTPGAAQMSQVGFAITDMDLELKTFALAETGLLPMIFGVMPEAQGGSDPNAATKNITDKKLALRGEINNLPDAAFPPASGAALAAFLSDLPNARGKLLVNFRSGSGFGPVRLARFALTGPPANVKEAAPIFDDTRFVIEWRRGDRS
ncbi:hypothetical protein HOY34_17075 [Xinfangfangia sp. D13-10-4-6]|uniref:hypothetical protein n=1 Tax=Pseudogemmobacter hezensis TaxID=2737662 RepID=UPI001556DB0D|nr:hypothetical protein [Pseudogemmobacter hezensis]NPD16908.1 hypothetical protein [Pseudogemmobacter hezensis]